jgi:glycosyltransferase involved in cell wall biosynthesis/SAM-dependent methyltransferase
VLGGDGDIEVSVVMPCLNEARTVSTCVRKARGSLERMGVRGEVLVADNGSTDGSQALAAAEGARVVHVERKGYGSALQGGIAEARGRFVVMGDADDSYDFSRLEPFIDRLRAGNDLVMGNRFKGGIKKGAMPWLHQYFGNPFLSWILNVFFNSPIHDTNCGLRAFRKDAYKRLNLTAPGMEFASEMVVKACLHRQRITEIPIVLHPDGRGRAPHLRSFRDGWRNLRLYLLLCPLWLYLIPSGFLLAVGLGLMTWLTGGSRLIGGVTFDVHTMLLGSLCALLGYQTLWLWAFARIYGWASRLLPANTFSSWIFDYINLERGLMAGGLMLASGVGLNLWLVHTWYGVSLGPLDISHTMRPALWGLTLMVAGVQTIYGSFFLSMLGIDKDELRTPRPPKPRPTMSLIERVHEEYVVDRRVRKLADHLTDLLPYKARVLDVGCGDGKLARLIADRRDDIEIQGIDVLVRSATAISVAPFDGARIPYPDASFDVVMFVDVLHHTSDPLVLLREAARVAKKAIVLKDHTANGVLARPTLRFMDRVGNARHGVALPHNYWSRRKWLLAFATIGFAIREWRSSLGLYPWPANWVFGRRLHFVARLERDTDG